MSSNHAYNDLGAVQPTEYVANPNLTAKALSVDRGGDDVTVVIVDVNPPLISCIYSLFSS